MIKVQKNEPFSLKFRFARFLIYIATFPFIKKIRGIKNLPEKGAFIAAANHSSLIDGPLLVAHLTRITKRHIHFLAKAAYYHIPPFRFLLETGKSIRLDPKEEGKSLFIALKYLQNGEIVSIFPEGTRSSNGKIKKGEPGVAALALTAKVSVIPIGLINTNKILPPGKFFPRLARCEVNIGKPLNFDTYYKDYDEALNQNDTSKILEIEEKVTRTIMKEIAQLAGQEYLF